MRNNMDVNGRKRLASNGDLSLPFEKVIGDSSPVVKTLKLLKKMIVDKPVPDIGDAASSAASLILVHLLNLMGGAGLLNATGYHSAAITLLRPMEDALDCFATVSLVHGASERWNKKELKASEAAKLWSELIVFQNNDYTLAEYRKKSREAFNNYSHCTPEQAHWNLYVKSIGNNKCTLELNTIPVVINSNGHRIDAYLIAHLYELLGVIEKAYNNYFSEHSDLLCILRDYKTEIIDILEGHYEHGCINVLTAPELIRIELNKNP